jgi:signal transduction histidine kinase
MDEELLFHCYQDYRSYVGWTTADEGRIRTAASVLRRHLQPLVDDFYAEIERHPETRRILTSNQTTLERLKSTLLQWLQELLSGPYDPAYVARRWRLGRRHREVGLAQAYFSTAIARLRAGLTQTLQRNWPAEPEGLLPAVLSLNKLLDLDLTIIGNAYQAAYLAEIGRNERLAKAGHVAGSFGHELRNPLNVLKTSAYYLRHAPAPSTGKAAEHLQRIEKHMALAEAILRELSDFAGTPAPQLRPVPIEACVDEALEYQPLPDSVRLAKVFPVSLPPVLADKDQIRSVFVRLVRRARDNMRDGGQLSISGQHAREGVDVVFEDSGPHLPQETLAAVGAPLGWNSVRALGMTLAVARALLESNGGRMSATSQPGRGCTMTVTLATSLAATHEEATTSLMKRLPEAGSHTSPRWPGSPTIAHVASSGCRNNSMDCQS